MLYFLYFLLFVPSTHFASSIAFTGTTADANEPWIRPASLTKLVLINQALDASPELSFKTTAHVPKCDNHQCFEPLIISLKDPLLRSEQLDEFAKTLSESVHTLNGSIQIQYQPLNSHQTGIFSEERYECYSATPTGIDLDQNCAVQDISPHADKLSIHGALFTIKRYPWDQCPHQHDPSDFIQDDRRTGWINPSQNTFHICDDNDATITLKSHVKDTKARFKKTLSDALTKYHIQHQDIIFVEGFKTPPLSSDAIISNTSLDQILTLILKKSNNFLAQFLHQHIGAPKLDPYIFDGSGLSRYNLIQPHTLNARIQSLIQKHPWVREHMLTEKDMGVTLPPNTHLYYKTGTLFTVKNIAGFIERPHHSPLFFTLTCAHPKSRLCQQQHKNQIMNLIATDIKS